MGTIRLVMRSPEDSDQAEASGASVSDIFGVTEKEDRAREESGTTSASAPRADALSWLQKQKESAAAAAATPVAALDDPADRWKVTLIEGSEMRQIEIAGEDLLPDLLLEEAAASKPIADAEVVGADQKPLTPEQTPTMPEQTPQAPEQRRRFPSKHRRRASQQRRPQTRIRRLRRCRSRQRRKARRRKRKLRENRPAARAGTVELAAGGSAAAGATTKLNKTGCCRTFAPRARVHSVVQGSTRMFQKPIAFGLGSARLAACLCAALILLSAESRAQQTAPLPPTAGYVPPLSGSDMPSATGPAGPTRSSGWRSAAGLQAAEDARPRRDDGQLEHHPVVGAQHSAVAG